MVAGGKYNNYFDFVYMDSVDTATWSTSTKMPDKRFYFGMVHIPAEGGGGRGQVIIAGGYVMRNGAGEYLDSVFIFNVDAATWSEPKTAIPIARAKFGMAYLPAQDCGGSGEVMVAGGYDGKNNLDSVFIYNVATATWSEPKTAMPVARSYFGMAYVPAQDGGGRGEVMVVGGMTHTDVSVVLDSVYFSAPVTTTSATTTTQITTTFTATATTATATTTTVTSTTITTTSTLTTTITATTATSTITTWLGVDAKCDPLADACDSSANLACAADVYECRYITTTTTTTTPTVTTFEPPAKTKGTSNGTVVGVVVLVVLLVLAVGCWWFFVGRRRNSRQDNNGDLGELSPVAIGTMHTPMPAAAAARVSSLGSGGGSDHAAPGAASRTIDNPTYQPADGPPNDGRSVVRVPNTMYEPAANNAYDAGVNSSSNGSSNNNRNSSTGGNGGGSDYFDPNPVPSADYNSSA